MYEHPGTSAINYFPCRYGKSKLLFRGPKRMTVAPFCAVLGGTETYGKFIERPFPQLLEEQSGIRAVNLGCVNAGVDVFVNDHTIMELCGNAGVTVVQALGAQNMSNRLYAVHPRRNDRFLRASPTMKTLYREVDFTEFNFTRHMLTTLKRLAPDKFGVVEAELKSAWVARMRLLAERLQGKTVLLLLSNLTSGVRGQDDLGPEPLWIDEDMVAELDGCFTEVVHVRASDASLQQGTMGKVFSPLDEPAAAEVPGPAVHQEIAQALVPVVTRLMG
ncbi:DUF6473 family protein [Actibacterium lipolyticum]|uniref:DUF6473 domain-containing protein n=1 Tax=Actibacterium lipolyticum TaxID=1524263 RepID=A0A238JJM0_9RHOB|nr:DUF6473 family protein [Actibacterium lipolyticum]SMX30861.1 hypothetical protein COL8621_00156 [Actibacterium lipolyticum]